MGNHSDTVMLEHQVCLQHDWEKQKEAEDLLCTSSASVCLCVCISFSPSLFVKSWTNRIRVRVWGKTSEEQHVRLGF